MAPQQTTSGEYLVLANDAVEVGGELMRLAPAHWDYIDRFAPKLVARGPLLSSDGERHIGSVHIIASADLPEAQRFAKEEPYYQANLYCGVTVSRFRNLLEHTMWERTPFVPPEYSTFMLANWQIRNCTAKQIGRLQKAGCADSMELGRWRRGGRPKSS